ncbi:hypothetical protein LSTR_LSTR005464 [Laodelphax striatellus]|uniref:SMP-30/Gluconolactonase/LRE-like region domain-containing protein n=1 Tax=Laodelphax striatellus TaxID=195883 RepID=A0A482WWR9_LAOST|nr:hypothetical protein LSTR_LSTR005464 [Laodelphax striatellus]
MMFRVEKCFCLILFISAASVYGDDYKVKSISKKQFGWGHSPYWDVKTQTLYFVDIYGGSVNSYKPATKKLFSAKIVHGPHATTSLIIPYEGMENKFVVGVNSSVANLTWDGMSSTASNPAVIAELTENKTLHSHTGKADPMGRLWIGTIAQFYKNSSGGAQIPLNQGAEYMISGTGKVIKRIPDITAPEGLVWSLNKTLMYFANCYEGKIQLYDYDNESGDISNKRVIFDGPKMNVGGLPAGMAMDTEGKIWVAQFTNGTVIRIDPDSGKVLRTLKLPAEQVTNLAFGGKNLDVLYVTTSQLNKGYIPLTKYAGRVYAITGLMSSDSDDYKVTSISKKNFFWGQSPFWDVKTQTLYFADIYGGTVNSYKPSIRRLCSAKIVPARSAKSQGTVSAIIPYEGIENKFVIGVNNSVANLTWDGMSCTASKPAVIAELTPNKTQHTHFGKADPMGRLWIGTIGQLYKNGTGGLAIPLNQGAQYMLSATGKVMKKISNITSPEGLVWSRNKTLMYFANLFEDAIELYDYDNESGDISFKRVVFNGAKMNIRGVPAGMAMDTEGKIWVSQVTNGTVIRVDPDSGKVLRTLKLPTEQLTSLVFGGKNLDVLYVTSSQLDKAYTPLSKYAGRVFAVTGLTSSSGKPIVGYPGQRIVRI